MIFSIRVRHNIEVAHRLWQLEGNKCQNIHGHSMWVTLELEAVKIEKGVAQGLNGLPLEFGEVKKAFRTHLDTWYDHRLLLNAGDPWAKLLQDADQHNASAVLPGLQTCEDDPTTENIAGWIAKWGLAQFQCPVRVLVEETHVNAASAEVSF